MLRSFLSLLQTAFRYSLEKPVGDELPWWNPNRCRVFWYKIMRHIKLCFDPLRIRWWLKTVAV